MTQGIELIWIDDVPERVVKFGPTIDGEYNNKQLTATIKLVPVKENFLDEISNLCTDWKKKPPAIILVDHSFSTVATRHFGMHGSALAHLIRIAVPNTPIVCITAQAIDSSDFDVEELSEYTDHFSINTLNEPLEITRLFSIAIDFEKVCFHKDKVSRDEISRVLLAPDGETQIIKKILPEEFESRVNHATTPHRVARWILHTLLKRPGFLYDALEAATSIGLSEKSFIEKVSTYFENARYRGPFASDENPRWWASSLFDCLYAVLPESHHDLEPRLAGRKVAGINEEDYSKCYVDDMNLPAPDAVAYLDASLSRRVAVKSAYADSLEYDTDSVLGFSARLVIKKD